MHIIRMKWFSPAPCSRSVRFEYIYSMYFPELNSKLYLIIFIVQKKQSLEKEQKLVKNNQPLPHSIAISSSFVLLDRLVSTIALKWKKCNAKQNDGHYNFNPSQFEQITILFFFLDSSLLIWWIINFSVARKNPIDLLLFKKKWKRKERKYTKHIYNIYTYTHTHMLI